MSQAIKDFLVNPRTRIIAQVLGLFSAFALLTALVYIFRAGLSGGYNWPYAMNLNSSDSEVLFHFMNDLLSGNKLDWVFSPQVYIFPEMVVSYISYLISQGNITLYFLWVAIINNLLLLAAIYTLIRLTFEGDTVNVTLKRTSVAALPLILFPLFGNYFLFYAHLLPTYYFGIYLATLLSPLLLFSNRKWVIGLSGAIYVLTAASNPMLLVVTIPSIAFVIVLHYLKTGNIIRPPLIRISSYVIVAMAIRFTLFAHLAGASTTSYVSPWRFAPTLIDSFKSVRNLFLSNNLDRYLLIITLAVAMLGVYLLLKSLRTFLMKKSLTNLHYVTVYLLALPILTMLAFYILMVPAMQYFWVAFVGYSVFLLILFINKPTAGGYVSMVLIALVLLLPPSISVESASRQSYFVTASPIATCLANNITGQTGVSEYAYARPYTLRANGAFHIAQIDEDLQLFPWLTNRTLFYENPITFIYTEGSPVKDSLSEDMISAKFGVPTKIVKCSDISTIYIFDYDLRNKLDYSF